MRGLAQNGQQRPDAPGVQLCACHPIQLAHHNAERQRGPVGSGAGHGVEGVGHGDDAGGQRGVGPLEAVRESPTVHALVVPPHRRKHPGVVLEEGSQDLLTDHRVPLDLPALGVRERPVLSQHAVRDPDLPDLM